MNKIDLNVEEIKAEEILNKVLEIKKDFDFLYSLVVVDRISENKFELNYVFARYKDFLLKTIRTYIDRSSPKIYSIANIFPSAEWEEREAYDMFGIIFLGHPNLRRILLPDDWPFGYPLRKDFVITDEIRNWTGTDLKW